MGERRGGGRRDDDRPRRPETDRRGTGPSSRKAPVQPSPARPAAGKPSPARQVPPPRNVPRARQVDAGSDTRSDTGIDGADGTSAAREVRIHGVNACRAFFRHRRAQVIRGYFTEAVARRHFAEAMRWMAAQRLAYHLVTDAELERIAGSGHHEGVCLLVRAQPPRGVEAWLDERRRAVRGCVLALENVGNPHNLGAILRVAAHFGVEAVVVPDAKSLAGGAAVRTAEGGAEFVEVLDAPDFAGAMRAFRAAGWRLVTTSSHQGGDVYRTALPPKSLVLFGEESAGLSAAMLAAGDACVRIPGTGRVESLNVSVAAGILVGEWWRQHGAGEA